MTSFRAGTVPSSTSLGTSVLPLAFGVPAHAPGRLGHLAAHSPFAASPNSRFAFPVCPGRTHGLPLPACTPSGALVTSRDLRAVIFTSVHSDIRVCSWCCTFCGVGQASHSTYLPLEGHAEQLLVPKPSVPSLPGEPRRSAWRLRLRGHRVPRGCRPSGSVRLAVCAGGGAVLPTHGTPRSLWKWLPCSAPHAVRGRIWSCIQRRAPWHLLHARGQQSLRPLAWPVGTRDWICREQPVFRL